MEFVEVLVLIQLFPSDLVLREHHLIFLAVVIGHGIVMVLMAEAWSAVQEGMGIHLAIWQIM
jgi:hypothetical protein